MESERDTKPAPTGHRGHTLTDEDRRRSIETRRRQAEERRSRRMSLLQALEHEAEGNARTLARSLVDKASKGDVTAHGIILDRLYGKATIKIESEHKSSLLQLEPDQLRELLDRIAVAKRALQARTIDGEAEELPG